MKVGFTCGAFDLLHAGHALMLQEARSVCDKLIVGLQTDPSYNRKNKNKPIQSLQERKIQLEAVKYVDEIIIYSTEENLLELLKEINPDIRIIGADHEGKKYTGYELPINTFFNSRDHSWSTTSLRNRIYNDELKKRKLKHVLKNWYNKIMTKEKNE
tara:strand:+ start:105 stop:575 length:471 start_codon:yes stop_codon:yes gene_type:complete